MPPALDAASHTHGYYSWVNHNAKAIYQRYIGWYKPAAIRRTSGSTHPRLLPSATWRRSAASTRRGNKAARTMRPAGTCASPPSSRATRSSLSLHDHELARALLAEVLERLGLGAENATWRNCVPRRRSRAALRHDRAHRHQQRWAGAHPGRQAGLLRRHRASESSASVPAEPVAQHRPRAGTPPFAGWRRYGWS